MELKVIKIELNNNGKPIASIQGTTSYYGISPNDTFYPQEEADKCIALLKDKANYNEYAYKLKSEELADTCRFYEDEIRHQKYKRCLVMAEMCEARYDEEDAKVNGCGASWEYISKEMKYWERWRWRWEALAEKFKDKETR